MEVTIDDTRIEPPADVETWGDLLDWVETRQLKPGKCITRVLFHGEEEIQYRQPAVCERVIHEVGQVNIESGNFDQVVAETMVELHSEIQRALDQTRFVVKLFEDRAEDRAHSELAQLLDSIRTFFQIFSEDLGWDLAPDSTANLEHAVRQLLAAQESKFWVSICDVLEYEIVPLLESWLGTVERTRARIH